MELRLDITKKGLPAIWESGGGSTNTGNAQIVAGLNGEALSPIYIRRAGSLSCSDHALFLCKEGMLVVEASHHRRDFEIRVWRVTRIKKKEDTFFAILESLADYSQGEWGGILENSPFCYATSGIADRSGTEPDCIYQAQQKALCYHCREPHFMKEMEMSKVA